MSNKLDRILYVEDEEVLQEIVSMALVDVAGYTLLACSSGPEAIEKAPAFDPQLVLLDVMMPGMDGPQTLAELKEMPAMSKIVPVFITAKVRPDEVARLKGLGAVDVIGKPFDPMTLHEQIGAIWDDHAVPAQSVAVEVETAKFVQRFRQMASTARAPLAAAREDMLSGDEKALTKALEDLRALAHRLSGSGGTFGFPRISEAAADLEDAAEEALEGMPSLAPADRKTVVERIDALMAHLG